MNSKDMNHHDNAPHEIDPVADARVTDALNGLGTVEPPPELIGQVMWRTKHQSVQNNSRRRVVRHNGEGLDMAKKVLIGLIGIAAAGLLVAYIGGFPATTGTEGTIGAAQRYNAEQIKKGDVKIENAALASFMQTDVFEKLSRDKMAVAALASPDVQAALADAEITAALADSTLAQALADPNVQAALANPALAQALASPDLQKALVDAAANGTGLNAAGLNKVGLDSQLASALANPVLAQALANKDLAAALAGPELQAALANPALAQALANPNFAAALAGPGLQGALANPALGQVLADSTAAQLLGAQLQNAQAAALGASGANALGASGALGK
jgi:hypothetical protein